MNWEADKVKRKSPIDFLKVIDNCKTYPLVEWLKQKFEDSDLPHSVDPDLVKSILNEIRKESLNLF